LFIKVEFNYLINLRLDAALDLENLVTGSYTGKYFMEQIDGMAKATGLDPKVIDFTYTY
jgi:hypothetical protein